MARLERKAKRRKASRSFAASAVTASSFRSFALHHEIDQANATAKYEDGVLKLTLPKQEGTPAKVVAVQ